MLGLGAGGRGVDFPGGSTVNNSSVNARDVSSAQMWVQSPGPLEKEMATHSSILAWEIPWTEESGRPQSMGSQRVGHDLATKQQ